MTRRRKAKFDGLGPQERAKIRSAIRQVWQRCHARKLCVDRAKLPDDYFRCEGCEQRVPKIYVDHIEPVGEMNFGFIERLFCPSHRLQALCKACHKAKTNAEKVKRKALTNTKD